MNAGPNETMFDRTGVESPAARLLAYMKRADLDCPSQLIESQRNRAVNKSIKIWYGIGAGVTLAAAAVAVSGLPGSELPMISSAHATNAAEPAKGTFVGDLEFALDNIFAGEGGEGGAGLTPRWPTVTAPALTGPEIAKVVTGNTLQLPGHASYYFAGGNRVEGSYIHWTQMSKSSDCPAQNVEDGDYYRNVKDGICWKKAVLDLQGKWEISKHQLCLDVSWSGGKKEGCRYVTILLDDIALFEATGGIDGKGHKLVKGKQLEK